MMNWKDTRYGSDGANLWLLYPGVLAVLSVIYIIIKLLITEDFTNANGALIIFWGLFILLIDRLLFSVLSIPKLKSQIVNASISVEGIQLDCYFDRKIRLDSYEITAIEECSFGYWYVRYSYLSGRSSNYCITTKSGQKFYISGDMPEVSSLVSALEEIIATNKDAVD